jgi:hypothetical protein
MGFRRTQDTGPAAKLCHVQYLHIRSVEKTQPTAEQFYKKKKDLKYHTRRGSVFRSTCLGGLDWHGVVKKERRTQLSDRAGIVVLDGGNHRRDKLEK